MQRHGLRIALSIVPLATFLTLLFLGTWRTTLLVAAVQVVHRVGEFSLMRPAREMIYTTVDDESRYKAKNFIDTAFYRANDAGIVRLVTAVRAAGLNAAWLVALPAAGLWLITGFRLGKRHDQRTVSTPEPDSTTLILSEADATFWNFAALNKKACRSISQRSLLRKSLLAPSAAHPYARQLN